MEQLDIPWLIKTHPDFRDTRHLLSLRPKGGIVDKEKCTCRRRPGMIAMQLEDSGKCPVHYKDVPEEFRVYKPTEGE